MNLKEEVLNLLLNQDGQALSGQAMADQLGVSRNAIWKNIEKLRQEGYTIQSIPQQGYQLTGLTKELDSQQIKQLIPDYELEIIALEETTSTNAVIRDHLDAQPDLPVVCVTQKQTQGRGRRGRSFETAIGKGLYMSIAVKPNFDQAQDNLIYTLLAAVAVARALEDYADKEVQIKWVNDLFLGGKKIAGILSEMKMDMENADVSYLIIGIGLNIAGSFDHANEEVQRVAGTVYGDQVPADYNPNELMAAVLNHFLGLHEVIPNKDFLEEYRDRMLGLDQEIYYMEGDQRHEAVLRGIDEFGALVVEDDQGQLHHLIGQEISLSSGQFVE